MRLGYRSGGERPILGAVAADEIILGIDLGTTYSTAAALIDGKMHFALDGRGEACIPSVVHFPKSGPPLVGVEAEKHRATDPHNTVFGIKRIIGRPADSPPARILNASSAVQVKQVHGSAEAAVVLRGRTYQASEVAALILRHLRERAEQRFLKKIGKAVLTVPVAATQSVRDAMVKCGRMAGLEVVRIITEPVGGALANAQAIVPGAPLLVYDFGGGTFDATVVEPEGRGLKVLGSSGDDCLGGDDLDLAFARWVADATYRACGKDIRADAILWERVQRTAEKVKRALSLSNTARFLVQEAIGSGPRAQALDSMVSRAQVAPLWRELVERSVATAQEAMEKAGLAGCMPGTVLLIGGTTYVPLVREAVAKAFGGRTVIETDPQTAVARGAALLAAQAATLAA